MPERPGGPAGITPLSPSELAHLSAALDDEYQARATYAQVIADFGDVRPFTNIVEAEDRHAGALIRIFERYGVPVPPDTWPGRAPRYHSLHEACAAGVAAEIANAALYEELLAGTERPDILAVYERLRDASQQQHLPAFRRCASRGDTSHGETTSGGGHEPRRHRRRHRGG